MNSSCNPAKKQEIENANQQKPKGKPAAVANKPKPAPITSTTRKPNIGTDTQSQCSSVKSVKSFATVS